MGEVYRATDTKLGRDVAIKLLPVAFAADPDRLARFEREAKLLASLNHPGIAHLYGFESAALPDGTSAHFLAMELVLGEDLADRLKRGPVPVEDAIPIARQIAEALEEAHEKGIVHRDLKPANVKLAPDGRVKVLDFGLAKAWTDDASGLSSSGNLSQSPTLAHTGTAAGLILGTAAYMSPEQARARPVDKRADIWAFGVVVYEMITGRRLFEGETVSDVLAAVLRQDVPWASLPPSTPAGVRLLLQRCLERDPKLRLRDIGEATVALGAAAIRPEPGAAAPAARLPRRGAVALVALALAALATGAWLGRATAPRPPVPRVVRLTFTPPLGLTLAQANLQTLRSLALSPDGTRLAYGANGRLYVRPLDALDPVEVPGSAGGSNPFFSPDGEWLGFSAAGALRKVSLTGGSPVQLPAPDGMASWSEDGTILVAAANGGIVRVPSDGGAARTLLPPAPGYVLGSPQMLPGARAFLFMRARPGDPAGAEQTVCCSVDGKDCAVVADGARDARYLRPGYLIFARPSGVMALPFDAATRRATGAAAQVEAVRTPNVYNNYFFDVSASGTLVYASAAADMLPTRLVAVTRAGTTTPFPGDTRYFSDMRVSPDGRRAAVHVQDEENDVWVVDLARGTLLRLSTAPGEDETPAWSPDGRFIAWTGSRPDTARAVFRRPSDGSGAEEVLCKTDVHLHVNDWSPDGRTLLLQLNEPTDGPGLYNLDLASRELRPFLQTRFREHSARISPSGRHVAYVSDESGRDEVYVQAFPEGGGKLRVSTEGGGQPLWSRDGRSIFFRDGRSVAAVRFEAGSPTAASPPEALFPDRFDSPQVGTHTGYDVFPDGRLLMSEAAEAPSPTPARQTEIVFVLNFLQNLSAVDRAR